MLRLRSLLLGLMIALLTAVAGTASPSIVTSQTTAAINIWLPLVVQQPPSVRVRNDTIKGLGSDRVVIVGEVLNELSVPVYLVNVTARFYDTNTYRPITIQGPQVRDNNGIEVNGYARNDEQKSLRTGKVAVTFYATDGTVVDTAASIIGKTFLRSGDRYPFTIRTGRVISFARLVIQAEGYVKP